MFQFPFPAELETEKKHKYCQLHIQIWTYIVSGVCTISSIFAIVAGILLLVYPNWHEDLVIYRQTLTYLRRANPIQYWLVYKIAASVLIGMHTALLISIISTMFAIRFGNMNLLKPNIVVLVFHIGTLILLISALFLLSVTGTKVTWLTLCFSVIYAAVTGFSLSVLALYHRFLDEKNTALQQLIANTKSVHFKERR